MSAADLTSLLRHSDWMRRLARDLVRDPHLADDLVQEAWAAAARRPPAPGAARSWLRRVITNAAYQHHRRESGRAIALAEEPPGAASSADEVLERAEMLHDVSARVLALPEPYRTTLIRRYFEGWMPDRIASEEGVPVSTVKTRLQRGLARLREELDAEHGGRRSWAALLAPFAGGTQLGAAAAAPDAAAAATSTSAAPLGATLAAAASLAALAAFAVMRPETPTPAPVTGESGALAARSPDTDLALERDAALRGRGVAVAPAVADASAARSEPPAAAASRVGWRGTVRDTEGEAIIGARVRLVSREAEVLREVTADDAGAYSLALGAADDLPVDFDVEFLVGQVVFRGTVLEVDGGAGFALVRKSLLRRPDDIEVLDLVVPDEVPLEVLAVDAATGSPLSGVTLEAQPSASTVADPLRADWYSAAVTGDDGRARLAIGRRDAVLLSARPTRSHFGATEAFVAAPDMPFELRIERAPPSLHFEAFDARTGQPVADAELRDVDSGALLGADAAHLAREGRALAVASGYLPRPVRVEGPDASVRVRMEPARVVELEVLRRGERLDATPAFLEWSLRHAPPGDPTRTPLERGRASLPIGFGAAPGVVVAELGQFDVVLPGGERQSFLKVVTGARCEGRLTLDLDPDTAPLRLRLLGPEGDPVAGSVVTAGSVRGRGGPGRPGGPGAPLASSSEWRGVTDLEGRVAFELPRHQERFWVRWDGDLELVEWPELDAEIELRAPHDATRIRGALLDPFGQPARDAARLLGHLELRSLAGESSVFVPLGTDGTFEARGVTPGTYEVVTPGFDDVLVQSGRTKQRVPAPEPYRWGLDLRDGRTGEPAVWEGRGVVRIEFGDGGSSVVTLYGDRPFALPAMHTAPASFVVDVPGFEPLTWTADSEAGRERQRRLTLLLYPD